MRYAIITLLFAFSAHSSELLDSFDAHPHVQKWLTEISTISDLNRGSNTYVLLYLAGVVKGADAGCNFSLLWVRARLRADAITHPNLRIAQWHAGLVEERCSETV